MDTLCCTSLETYFFFAVLMQLVLQSNAFLVQDQLRAKQYNRLIYCMKKYNNIFFISYLFLIFNIFLASNKDTMRLHLGQVLAVADALHR